jgi:hypothetical protein
MPAFGSACTLCLFCHCQDASQPNGCETFSFSPNFSVQYTRVTVFQTKTRGFQTRLIRIQMALPALADGTSKEMILTSMSCT